jgi:hypothetical protein
MAPNDIPQDLRESIENVIRKIDDTHSDVNHIKGIVETLRTANLGVNQAAIIRDIDELEGTLRNIEAKVDVTLAETHVIKGMVDMSTHSNPPDVPGATEDDNARKSIEDLLKILIATSGVVLALLWALTQRSPLITKHVFHIIRWASFILVLAMGAGFLSYQFSITRLQKNLEAAKQCKPWTAVSKHPTIAVPFLVAWISFLIGCAFLLWAMWNIKFKP